MLLIEEKHHNNQRDTAQRNENISHVENGKIDEWEQELTDEMNNASNSASDLMYEQTLSQIDQINDALEQMAEGKEDLQDALKDLEHIMRYTSAQLALSIVQLTDSVALIEDQIALIDKSIAVYELQEKLGMATTINVDTQCTSKLEAENQLRGR